MKRKKQPGLRPKLPLRLRLARQRLNYARKSEKGRLRKELQLL